MTLKPGALPTSTDQHDHLWPELAAEIRACGIKKIATLEDDPYLFVCSEVQDEGGSRLAITVLYPSTRGLRR
jgi:L-rhamnose mutarotase